MAQENFARRFIVGIGGTSRPSSTSEKIVRAVLSECEALGAETQMFDGPSLDDLPHYNPTKPERTDGQIELVATVRRCDGLIIGSPGYHGGYSGMVKNAIDLLEDLRTDVRPYFDGRPVGLVVTAAGWQACGTTLSALRDVIHAMRGWPTPIGLTMNSIEQQPFNAEGSVAIKAVAEAIRAQAFQLMNFSATRAVVAERD